MLAQNRLAEAERELRSPCRTAQRRLRHGAGGVLPQRQALRRGAGDKRSRYALFARQQFSVLHPGAFLFYNKRIKRPGNDCRASALNPNDPDFSCCSPTSNSTKRTGKSARRRRAGPGAGPRARQPDQPAHPGAGQAQPQTEAAATIDRPAPRPGRQLLPLSIRAGWYGAGQL